MLLDLITKLFGLLQKEGDTYLDVFTKKSFLYAYLHSLHLSPNNIRRSQYPHAIETSSCFPENRCLMECENFKPTVGVRGDCDIEAKRFRIKFHKF